MAADTRLGSCERSLSRSSACTRRSAVTAAANAGFKWLTCMHPCAQDYLVNFHVCNASQLWSNAHTACESMYTQAPKNTLTNSAHIHSWL
jgi:hypothetical protein